ncbi:hypothetical protein [Amycolatopsis australiensis]|uniref:Membrane protein YfhO n=1 Tax=Amycolatopsis australiensis TaxID=546364 RepID=A0A1K1RC04_9PSEU|nr:hypothetical protein [Amycolatopsis australiensis]SFW69770.1 hypothetical protein SAMN04489730_3023 [Amycolatopsis australiensis]
MDAPGRRFALPAVSALLAFAVCAPLLGRGFVLGYDMVFAPRQYFVPDAFGLGSTLPRSVPADAAVALATTVLPGDIVQKVVLLAAVFFAALGAGRLVPTEYVGTRLVAATAYAWTPYLAERLLIGHWPLLLTYACLPWIAAAGLAARRHEPHALPKLVIACAPAVLTPPGGVLAAAVMATAAGSRRLWQTIPIAVVLNLPWLVPAFVNAEGTFSDPAGVPAFSARAESWGPALFSVLGLGGIWNAETVPGSRAMPLVPVLTLVVAALAVAGLGPLTKKWGKAPARSVFLLGVAGVLLASLATLPGGHALLTAATRHLPGAGLLRDAQKWVAWWALPLALGLALAVEALAAKLKTARGRVALVTAAAVLPLLAMPDLAWGGWGRLGTAQYPPDWRAVSDVLGDRPGDVLAVPLSAFRGFAWNGGRTQLDPAPRVLPRPVLVDDTLQVGPDRVTGEDPRIADVRAATSARELTAAGIGWILVEHGTPGDVDPRLLADATPVWSGDWLTLYRTPGVPAVKAVSWTPALVANGVALALLCAALLCRMLPMRTLSRGRNFPPRKE